MLRGHHLLRLLRATVAAGADGRPACARIHPIVIKSGRACNARVTTALADAYAKSGLVIHVQNVFDETPLKDPVLWNVMLSCSIS